MMMMMMKYVSKLPLRRLLRNRVRVLLASAVVLHHMGTADGSVLFIHASPLNEDARNQNDVGNSHSNPIARGDTCTFRQCGASAASAARRGERGLLGHVRGLGGAHIDLE